VFVALFGIVAVLNTGFAETPKVLSDRVVFIGGKVVRYEASKVWQSDPKAIQTDDVVSFTERPVVLATLKRVVIVREERLYEGGSMQLSVYDFHGTLLGSSESVAVEADGLFFLESKRRIFLGQSSSHAAVDSSLLLDQNGQLVQRVSHPRAVGSFGHSRDEQLLWIVSNIWVRTPGENAARQIGELRMIDTDGKLLARREFDRPETVVVRYEGRSYNIPVEVPTLP
jgi:hypothetical protein